jgi:hypothetical protein
VGKLKSSLVRGLLLTRKLLNKGFIVVMLNLTTMNRLFSSFLVSSNPLSSDDFNITTMNPFFSSFLVKLLN